MMRGRTPTYPLGDDDDDDDDDEPSLAGRLATKKT